MRARRWATTMQAMVLAQPAGSTVSALSAGVEAP